MEECVVAEELEGKEFESEERERGEEDAREGG